MKIVLTIQSASDGGAFLSMTPEAHELMEQSLDGRGTTAHAYALAAYRAIHDMATRELVGDGSGQALQPLPESAYPADAQPIRTCPATGPSCPHACVCPNAGVEGSKNG